MAYVITNRCLGERYATCVAVCPCDCIHAGEHEGQPFMVIDPEVCIDCSACISECPIGAIVGPGEDPASEALNARLAPLFKANSMVEPRSPSEAPHRPENQLAR